MRHLFISFIAILILQGSCSQSEPVLVVGLVADPQYADKPAAGSRFYRESIRKLREALVTFNDHDVDVVQTLGDVIDGGWENFGSILPVYGNLDPEISNYHLLGNHDFAVDSSRMPDLLDVLSMPGYYYSYTKEDVRFIVLDATDVAFFSNAIHRRPVALVDSCYMATEGNPNHQTWNSAIGEAQQDWLRNELDVAGSLGERVIIFSHHPVRPLKNPHNLWNDHEIIAIIENHPHVAALINGHNHKGSYEFQNGVHYITIHGMVEDTVNSFAILEIYDDHMELRGFGDQESIHLGLNE